MRTDPTIDTVEKRQATRQYNRRVKYITRIIALVVAFLSTYTFIVKILFF